MAELMMLLQVTKLPRFLPQFTSDSFFSKLSNARWLLPVLLTKLPFWTMLTITTPTIEFENRGLTRCSKYSTIFTLTLTEICHWLNLQKNHQHYPTTLWVYSNRRWQFHHTSMWFNSGGTGEIDAVENGLAIANIALEVGFSSQKPSESTI